MNPLFFGILLVATGQSLILYIFIKQIINEGRYSDAVLKFKKYITILSPDIDAEWFLQNYDTVEELNEVNKRLEKALRQ